jgi:hypothetical protein
VNCPKCPNQELIIIGADWANSRPYCKACGWMPHKPFVELVKLDVGYRLAKLKAEGAAPGWYGPDGERCGLMLDGCLEWLTMLFTQEEARLCGFVEVKP